MAQVWTVGVNEGYEYTLDAKLLGGDLRKVKYVDRTPEIGTIGGHFKTGMLRSGRPWRPENIPTTFVWGGDAPRMPDFIQAHGVFMVSETVREIVEAVEPDVHQFFPLQAFAKGNTPARKMYIMNVCNRIDSVDRTKTTISFVDGRAWELSSSGEVVFSLNQIGPCKIWHDKHIHYRMYFADEVKRRFDDAQVTGVRYFGYRAE